MSDRLPALSTDEVIRKSKRAGFDLDRQGGLWWPAVASRLSEKLVPGWWTFSGQPAGSRGRILQHAPSPQEKGDGDPHQNRPTHDYHEGERVLLER